MHDNCRRQNTGSACPLWDILSGLVLCDSLRLVGASIDQAQPNATDICLVQRENDVLVV